MDQVEAADQKADETAIVETKEAPRKLSARDSLRAAFEIAEKAAPEVEDKKEPKESPETKKSADERARDEQGRFAPKTEDKAPEKVEAAPVETKPATPATVQEKQEAPSTAQIAVPVSWSPEAKAEWAKLSPAIQAAVLKREREVSEGFKQKSDQIKRYEEIDAVINPRADQLKSLGYTSPAQAINHLFTLHDSYENNPGGTVAHLVRTSKNPIETLKTALVQLGVNSQTLAQLPQGAVQQPQFDPNALVTQAQKTAREEATRAAQEQLQTYFLNREIETFSKDKPHFEHVRENMGKLMSAGFADTLEDAYQKAIDLDPQLKGMITAEAEAKRLAEAAKQEEERRAAEAAQAEKAKKAAVSVKGSPPGGPARHAKVKSKSIRDNLLEGFGGGAGRL